MVSVPVNVVHPLNALSPIAITESGIVSVPVKYPAANACLPIVITESGIVSVPVILSPANA